MSRTVPRTVDVWFSFPITKGTVIQWYVDVARATGKAGWQLHDIARLARAEVLSYPRGKLKWWRPGKLGFRPRDTKLRRLWSLVRKLNKDAYHPPSVRELSERREPTRADEARERDRGRSRYARYARGI